MFNGMKRSKLIWTATLPIAFLLLKVVAYASSMLTLYAGGKPVEVKNFTGTIQCLAGTPTPPPNPAVDRGNSDPHDPEAKDDTPTYDYSSHSD
jgi:hypothetical protein